jgi:hypothetical protein
MDVKYNEETDTVEITDKVIEEPKVEPTPTPAITKTPDGIRVYYDSGEYYIDIGGITSVQMRIHNETSSLVRYSLDPITIPYEEDYSKAQLYKHIYSVSNATSQLQGDSPLCETSKELIFDNIELFAIEGRLHLFIKYDYYINTIMPLME